MNYRHVVCLMLLMLPGCGKSAEQRSVELEQQKLTLEVMGAQQHRLAELTEKEREVRAIEERNQEALREIQSGYSSLQALQQEVKQQQDSVRKDKAKLEAEQSRCKTEATRLKAIEQKYRTIAEENSQLQERIAAAVSAWGPVEGDQLVGFGGGFGQGPGSKVVTVKAQFTKPANDKPAQLFVEATIERGWHIYSITQSNEGPGPTPTTIKLLAPKGSRLLGDFQAIPAPASKKEKAFNDLVVESHSGKVVWYAPIQLAPGVNPATLKIEGAVRAQPCTSRSSLPPTEFPFAATLAPGISVPEPKPAEAQVSPAVPALPSTKPGQASIRLSAGVALPQTGPEGTLMSFSVDYQFTQGEPNTSGYVWVIQRAQGAPAKQPVRLARQGNLPILIPGWRPQDGPFKTHIEDNSGKRLSPSIDLR